MDDYEEKIKKEIIEIIQKKLSNGSMSPERAKQIAHYILTSLKPHLTFNQIYKITKEFDKHFPEIREIEIEIGEEYEKRVKELVFSKIDTLIKAGKLDEANTLLEQANDGKLE